MQVALVGALLIFCGIILTAVQLAVSIRARHRNRDLTGDPWNGRTLEWSTFPPAACSVWEFRPPASCPQVRVPMPSGGKSRIPQEDDTTDGPAQLRVLACTSKQPYGLLRGVLRLHSRVRAHLADLVAAVVGLIGLLVVGLMQAWRTDGEVHVSADEVAAADRTYPLEARAA